MPAQAALPTRVNSAVLKNHFLPGDPTVVVKLVEVGNRSPFDLRSTAPNGRTFVFEWNTRHEGHVVFIPLSVWMANSARVAHEVMNQRRMPYAMVVTFEVPVPVVVENPIPQSQPETGAAANNVAASIVVGRDDTQPAAPSSGDTNSPTTPPSATPASTDVPLIATVSEPVLIDGKPLHEAAYALLVKPQRIKALATTLKVDEDTLRAGISTPESQVEIAGPWVRRRA